jgi:phosphoserine phosphatase
MSFPANQREPHFKWVIFDLDGTLTQERSIWEYIHKQLGKWYGFAEEYQKQFLAGEISYERFCELDAEVWKGMRVEELLEIVKRVPFHHGAGELIDHLKKKGLKLAVVSSGLSMLSNWVHQKYGFDYSVSNALLHSDGVLNGKVKIQVYYDQKAEWVRRILENFEIKPEEVISIAINSSCKDLETIANICVQSQNLADIIPRLPL